MSPSDSDIILIDSDPSCLIMLGTLNMEIKLLRYLTGQNKNSILHSIQKELKEVNQEIGNYPSPITGCDVQFNDLLKRRSELEMKMREMKAKPEITMWQGGNLY